MDGSIKQSVIKIVEKAINVENLNETCSQYMYSEWDSLAYLNIAMMVEEKFNITIDEKNINEFGSITQIINIINNAINNDK